MQFKAKNYLNRNGLEMGIRAEVGVDAGKNKEAGHTIFGTREELKKLRIDDTSTVFGVACTITDTPTKGELAKKLKAKNKK